MSPIVDGSPIRGKLLHKGWQWACKKGVSAGGLFSFDQPWALAR